MITTFKMFETNSKINWELFDVIEFNNRVDKVDKLVKQGADVNFIHPEFGWSPLTTAIERDRESIVKYLLKNGADVNLIDNNGLTSLFYAADHESFSSLQLLIDAGADWFIKDKHGDYFVDILSEEMGKIIAEMYPEKYQEYLIRKKADKYNL